MNSFFALAIQATPPAPLDHHARSAGFRLQALPPTRETDSITEQAVSDVPPRRWKDSYGRTLMYQVEPSGETLGCAIHGMDLSEPFGKPELGFVLQALAGYGWV